jgi:hypothetical protein
MYSAAIKRGIKRYVRRKLMIDTALERWIEYCGQLAWITKMKT